MTWKEFIELFIEPLLVKYNRQTLTLNLTLQLPIDDTLYRIAELTTIINEHLKKRKVKNV